MKRAVVLGRGGAGKSALALRLGKVLNIPVIELDKHFWQAGLTPLPPERWREVQRKLMRAEKWIMDGDLGKYDVLEVRLGAADTVIVLDYSLIRCLWRGRLAFF